MSDGGRRRFSVRLWLGVALLVVGAGFVGYLAWELYGTNIIAKHNQAAEVSRLQELWQQGLGPDAEKVTGGEVLVTPSPSNDPSPTKTPRTPGTPSSPQPITNATPSPVSVEGQALALIRIPRFGPNYVIPVYEGTSDWDLAHGFGHYLGTAGAGQVGNYAVAGHRTTWGHPLLHILDLRPGDKVFVETRRFIYTYVLDTNPNNLIVPFYENWVLRPVPNNPKPGGVEPAQAQGQSLITMTTCTDFLGNVGRFVVFGHLVSTQKK